MRATLAVVVFLLLGRAPLAGVQSAVDFSGIDLFWRVHDELSADREPPSALWDSLFATPGYAALDAREQRRPLLERAFRIAYRPSFADSLDAVTAAGGWVGYVLPHLRRVPPSRTAMEDARRALAGLAFLDEASQRAAIVLPPDATGGTAPQIAFIVFAADGRGYPGLIVADLLRVTSFRPEARTGFFAHELFHVYRRNIAPRTRAATPRDAPLVALLGVIEEEGIADLLDKRDIPHLPEAALSDRVGGGPALAYYEEYQRQYHAAGDAFARIDAELEAVAADPERAADANAAIRSWIPLEGRPLGAFMANTIDEGLGRAALIDAVADPFAFFLAYDTAARRSRNAPPLGPATVRVITGLRELYALRIR